MTTTRRDLLATCTTISALLATRSGQSAAAAPTSSNADGVLRGFLNVAEGQIHYRYRRPTHGRSTPLFMLHGFPSSAWILQPYVAQLGTDRATYAFDLMGMGDSTGLAKPHPGIDDLAKAVLHGLDALEVETCNLYGTLTGARVATELALLAPRRVRKLILDEPAFSRRRRSRNFWNATCRR